MHVAMYLCSLISLGFTAMWASKLLYLECGAEIPILPGPLQCVIRAVGVVIFGSSFVGSLAMIAYYDDENQTMLKRKQEEQLRLSVSLMSTLSAAMKLIGDLNELTAKLSEEVVSRRWTECRRIIFSLQASCPEKCTEVAQRLVKLMYEMADIVEKSMEQKRGATPQAMAKRYEEGKEMLLKKLFQDKDDFPEDLLVSPWKKYVDSFSEDCKSWKVRFATEAGVYINLTAAEVKSEVIDKESPGGLPTGRSLKALYLMTERGLLSKVYDSDEGGVKPENALLGHGADATFHAVTMVSKCVREKPFGEAAWSPKCYVCLPLGGLHPIRICGQCVCICLRQMWRSGTAQDARQSMEHALETGSFSFEAMDHRSQSFSSSGPTSDEGICQCEVFKEQKRCTCFCWSLTIQSRLHERLMLSGLFALCYMLLYLVMLVVAFRNGCEPPYNGPVSCWDLKFRKFWAAFFFGLYFVATCHSICNLSRLDLIMEIRRDILLMQELTSKLYDFDTQRMKAEEIVTMFKPLVEGKSKTALWNQISACYDQILRAAQPKQKEEQAQSLLGLLETTKTLTSFQRVAGVVPS